MAQPARDAQQNQPAMSQMLSLSYSSDVHLGVGQSFATTQSPVVLPSAAGNRPAAAAAATAVRGSCGPPVSESTASELHHAGSLDRGAWHTNSQPALLPQRVIDASLRQITPLERTEAGQPLSAAQRQAGKCRLAEPGDTVGPGHCSAHSNNPSLGLAIDLAGPASISFQCGCRSPDVSGGASPLAGCSCAAVRMPNEGRLGQPAHTNAACSCTEAVGNAAMPVAPANPQTACHGGPTPQGGMQVADGVMHTQVKLPVRIPTDEHAAQLPPQAGTPPSRGALSLEPQHTHGAARLPQEGLPGAQMG